MRFFLAIIFLLGTINSHAQDISFANATIRQPFNNITSAYVDIINNSNHDDKLLAIKTAIANQFELHSTSIDENGTAKMQRKKYIHIKKNSTTKLTSGELHIMLIDLTKKLQVGEQYNIEFIFENAGTISTLFEVKKLADTLPEHDHQH